jgi:hypothetical protein
MGELDRGLAEKINAEHRACEQAAATAVEHAMNAGDYLEEAKAGLAHGEFLPWLKENFEGSRQTADVYRKLASNRERLNCQRAGNLSIRGALAELSAPVAAKAPEPETSPVETAPEEPQDPMAALKVALEDDEEEWYDFERDVPLTKADIAYLVRVIGEDYEVGRRAAGLFFGGDPSGFPRLNPHGVRDPYIAVLTGRVLQECGLHTYYQLFEQFETTDPPLMRHDRTQLEFLLSLGRKEPDPYTADIVAMVGARSKLEFSKAQLSYLVGLFESGVPQAEVAGYVRKAKRDGESVYYAAGHREVCGPGHYL